MQAKKSGDMDRDEEKREEYPREGGIFSVTNPPNQSRGKGGETRPKSPTRERAFNPRGGKGKGKGWGKGAFQPPPPQYPVTPVHPPPQAMQFSPQAQMPSMGYYPMPQSPNAYAMASYLQAFQKGEKGGRWNPRGRGGRSNFPPQQSYSGTHCSVCRQDGRPCNHDWRTCEFYQRRNAQNQVNQASSSPQVPQNPPAANITPAQATIPPVA